MVRNRFNSIASDMAVNPNLKLDWRNILRSFIYHAAEHAKYGNPITPTYFEDALDQLCSVVIQENVVEYPDTKKRKE